MQLSVDDSPAVLSELGFPAEDHGFAIHSWLLDALVRVGVRTA